MSNYCSKGHWENGMQFPCKQCEIEHLSEQVYNLKAELKSIDGALDDPRANLTLTTSEIIWELKDKLDKLTKERDIKEHCITQFELEDLRMKEQLAAIAEQNEKIRKALTKWRYLDGSYNWRCGHCGNEEGDEHKEGCALSLPDLDSPVLNRIKAETLEAFKVELIHLVANGEASISEISVAVDALEARIDKLTNKEKGEVK